MKNSTFLFCLLTVALNGQPVELEMLANWQNDTIVGSVFYDNAYNEVWGYENNGREYAIIGSTMGTHIFEVMPDGTLGVEHFVQGNSWGDQIVHRDYDNLGHYLYAVCDENGNGNGTLQIIDLSKLPNEVEVAYSSNQLIERCHNIFIDKGSHKLYACSRSSNIEYSHIRVYSLDDPTNPIDLGAEFTQGITFGHAHDIYTHNDTAFINIGYEGLMVVDFTMTPPQVMARYEANDYPYAGYNHSGWADKNWQYYYFADETHGSLLKTVKINEWYDMEILETFGAGNPDSSIVHNLLIDNDMLYVSYYYDGLQVFSLADPANPQLFAYYETSSIPLGDNYKGAWGVYPFLPSGKILVSDMQEGLFVFSPILSTNIDENEIVDIHIFPNPSNDILNISTSLPVSSIRIIDLVSNIAMEKILQNQASIDISNLSKGVYIIELYDEYKKIKSCKFTKI